MPSRFIYPRSFVAAINDQPAKLFWAFALAHCVLWTLIPALSSPNAPLDVIEGYAWGREWLLGTYKHPPMQAWCLQIMAVLTNRAAWVPFLASQIAVVTAFWAIWQVGRRLTSETVALVAVLLLEGIVYYNFTSAEFNPNVLELPFWALICLSFHKAIKENRLLDWALLGLWSVAGLYSKYSTFLLLLTLTFVMAAHPMPRRRLKGVGPYLTIAIAVLLFLPHMLWLIKNQYLPFEYAMGKLHTLATSKHHQIPSFVLSPISLLFGQIVALLPFTMLLLVFYGRSKTSDTSKPHAFDLLFLDAITFGPFILTLALSLFLGFKVNEMWGMPFWNFIGLWALIRFRFSMGQESLVRFTYAWDVVVAGMLIICLGVNILCPYLQIKTMRIHFPGRALADYVTNYWHDRYHAPLHFVIGDTWAAGNVGYYARERPHVFIQGDKTISPWIKLHDLEQDGGVIVWCVKHCLGGQDVDDGAVPDFVRDHFPEAEIKESFSLARQTEADVPPVKIGWAIVPPGSLYVLENKGVTSTSSP